VSVIIVMVVRSRYPLFLSVAGDLLSTSKLYNIAMQCIVTSRSINQSINQSMSIYL